jgi:phosphate transport system protein
MPAHLQREIDVLKRQIRSLGVAVESSVSRAVEAFEDRDAVLAQDVIRGDEEIDRNEVEVEEECLKIVALHQPVAMDLRFIIAILKINSDLERIGDLAVNIAERAAGLATQPKLAISISFVEMAKKVRLMVIKSLDALVNMNIELARQICADDDEVDAINREMFACIQAAAIRHPENVKSLLQLLSISRNLERMADHTTNIAEDIIYMIEGEIVRHRHEECAPHTQSNGRQN